VQEFLSMRNKAYVASNSLPSSTEYINSMNNTKLIHFFSDAMVRRKTMWIIFGIIVSIVIIAAIVIPITIVLTRKTNGTATTTMAMKTIEVTTSKGVSSTKKSQ
jgi:hypothetical protein